MNEIIPKNERSIEPLDTEYIMHHPDMVKANEWILKNYNIPKRPIAIFVPCSKKKPYHLSPSHKIFDKVIFSLLEIEDVHIITFGTCGIVPRELDEKYPFYNYKFMMGKCNIKEIKDDFFKVESKRIC